MPQQANCHQCLQGERPAEKCQRCSKDGKPCSAKLTAEEELFESSESEFAPEEPRSRGIKRKVQLDNHDGPASRGDLTGDSSPLMSAIIQGNSRIADLLLYAGADPNERCSRNGTCLEIASSRGLRTIVESLSRAGADLDACGVHYRSALHAASWHGHVEVVEILLQQGASVNGMNGPNSISHERPESQDTVEHFQQANNTAIELSSRQQGVPNLQVEDDRLRSRLRTVSPYISHTTPTESGRQYPGILRSDLYDTSSQDRSEILKPHNTPEPIAGVISTPSSRLALPDDIGSQEPNETVAGDRHRHRPVTGPGPVSQDKGAFRYRELSSQLQASSTRDDRLLRNTARQSTHPSNWDGLQSGSSCTTNPLQSRGNLTSSCEIITVEDESESEYYEASLELGDRRKPTG